MDAKYFEMLSNDSKDLVNRVESKIGEEVEVKIDPSRVDKLACDIDDCEPKILIPKENYFPDSSVIHELLHLERFCIEEIPLLCTCNDDYEEENKLISLDNNLEHLIIVPEEIKLLPERYKYWINQINKKLVLCEEMIASEQNPSFDLLIYWAFISRSFKASELLGKMENILSRTNILERAHSFLTGITPIIYCKRQLVNVCIEYIGISKNNICLEFSDFNKKSKRKESLAEIS